MGALVSIRSGRACWIGVQRGGRTLFSRNIWALNWGTLGLVLSQTISPSQACMNLPISVGGQLLAEVLW